jgi:hypothetical protein
VRTYQFALESVDLLWARGAHRVALSALQLNLAVILPEPTRRVRNLEN